MVRAYEKYHPFPQVPIENREWPSKTITKAPIWCSVDLRDGNQALVEPMNLDEKLLMFNTLINIGFKEIEVGFPSASETEYEIIRTLIEENYIPDDVTIQVLVQAREHLIRKTFEAIRGAKNVILHFYNSTSALQRKVVFKTDVDGIIDIAVNGAKLIKKLSKEVDSDMNLRFEYSPESFSGTEMDNAVKICSKVMEVFEPTKDNKIILNLPATVECSTPNCYADQIEYFCKHLPGRENAIISIHPHNDRGTGVASAELGLLAGAERVEGTLFGNGERTGNVDIVTLALNMYSQGIDPKLNFSNIKKIMEVYEKTTKMKVPPRHPYAGELVFTAFSGSHQDAINKGMEYMRSTGSKYWEVPYLPIDPADIGRDYEPIIRINSQSGKGGAAYIMQTEFGYNLPKEMRADFGAIVKARCDETGKELKPQEVFDLFKSEYIGINEPYELCGYSFKHERTDKGTVVKFIGEIKHNGVEKVISGTGNGPIDAFFRAIKGTGLDKYVFVSYNEQAISDGSDSLAVSYIQLKDPDGRPVFGVGIDSDISIASLKAIMSAINRSLKK
ncbi:2-isopropylmalate synthase [[Clostridium] cellulosi]|uniref:2-isopropylmalate synthase n=1 Tax=[Clostridium] cellulosi TaxID=29343 RepID=A0A078KR16_9FIRM|nr:2-isopropylmalate synthase [[Clostridium] cellulosi]